MKNNPEDLIPEDANQPSEDELASMQPSIDYVGQQLGFYDQDHTEVACLMPSGTDPNEVFVFYAEKLGTTEIAADDWGDGVISAKLTDSDGEELVAICIPMDDYLGVAIVTF